jgi:hypothetical protein
MLRLLLISLFLSSCGDKDQKKYFALKGLRILGIIADQPEINSAQTVNLTPYLSYTDGGDTTLSISYKACVDPGIDYGAKVSCDSYAPAYVLTGSTTFTTNTIGSANFYTGPMTSIAINVPAAAFTAIASLDSKVKFNGVDYIVIFTISDQAKPENKITTIKRISLTSKTSGLNSNPTMTGSILIDGATFSSFPSKVSNLSLDGPSSAENYQYEGGSGLTSVDEIMTVTWFASAGEYKYSRSDADASNEYDPKGNTSGVFVAVYRDNRGGLIIKREVFP